MFVPKDRRSLFRQFLSGMYDAVVITDPNGHILEINPRAVEYFGRESDEVVDQPISVFIPGLKQDVVLRIRKGIELGKAEKGGDAFDLTVRDVFAEEFFFGPDRLRDQHRQSAAVGNAPLFRLHQQSSPLGIVDHI